MPNDFEAFAKTALGTDDPERIAAFKNAIMACEDAADEGDYSEDDASETTPTSGIAKGKGSMLAKLFGGGKG